LNDIIDLKTVDNLGVLVSFCTAELASERTGITVKNIKDLASKFAKSKSAVCYGRLGVSTVKYGSLSQWAINVINILTGNFDRKGGAMFPEPAFDSIKGKKMSPKFGRWKSRVRALPEYGGELPSATLAEEILTPGEGQIRALFTNCGNPILSTPNGQQLDKAFEKLDLMISIDIYINETTQHADYILPPAAGLEVAHFDIAFNNLAIRNTVKYSDPIIPKEDGTLYDYEIFQGLMKSIEKDDALHDVKAQQHRETMYNITPQMMLDQVMKTGKYKLTVNKLRDHPHGIDLGPLMPNIRERLITPDKRIDLIPKIYANEILKIKKDKPAHNDKLSLIGRRHLRSNNSWMHNSHRLVKGTLRCIALIHPYDAKIRGISTGDMIIVTSRVGEVKLPVEVTKSIAKGVISIPHGWGHDRNGVSLSIAKQHAGVSLNDLTDELLVEELTGVTILSGVPVEVALDI
ncbi:MAG: molybdopterin dinucleotide binding domain-containing protein, partial [Saprospiraceae bacterium]